MKRGSKFLFASGLAVSVAVACAVGLQFPSSEARDAATSIETAISDYRGGVAGPKGEGATPRLFSEAFEYIRLDYVRPTDEAELLRAAVTGMKEAHPDPTVATDAEMIEAAVRSMLGSLDNYSSYYDAAAFKKFREEIRGSFGGLGIEIRKHDTRLEIISPIDGTPAAGAGLLPGDLLTHADGESLADLTLREAVDLLRGAPGTPVTLTITRGKGGDTFDVSLTREIIRIVSVRGRIEDGIGILRITHFVRNTGDTVRATMQRLSTEAGSGVLKGYVVDLRSNPGGLLDQSIVVAGSFLSGGVVVSTRSRVNESSYDADKPNPSGSLPVVVLINEGSASASEIVAGAIKDRERGLIVGQKSFGKGSVQTAYEVGAGGGLKLTTALYYTPSGQTVESGIIPDVEAVDDPDTEEVDEALDVALDLLMDMANGRTVLGNTGTTIE